MTMKLVVRRSSEIADGIRELALARPDAGPLPAHPPGSHVVVECGRRRNAYSLTNCGIEPYAYTVAVLHRPDGDGGSEQMHRFRVGDRVAVSTPRSAFPPVSTARRQLLVAGGIGITPMLGHARHAVRWGSDVRLLYVHRPGAGAYAGELAELLGGRMQRATGAAEFGALLHEALTTQPIGTHLYVCGPQRLMDRVLDEATAAGWPPQRLHLERFTPAELDPGQPFTARLARSGRRVPVPAGTSLLEALEQVGVAVPNMCRQGVCGECRVPVLAGRPLHRDEFLSEDERAEADSVMCCVSRSETETLEVDL
ncbi:PDR/VanB family oxidoreductase [Streptomyces sp. NBC_01373]|uniref:PDR/VanB family oxidoreductase n=1 Tax=Streptomyces sp. NBC_01373 TaxID=2903843 RepID=UPI00224FF280|nr:PDR/VanB family oxidoreductase [Streptomyces sp. NBC_01373]MCX4706146.1 PDR/VanB family oxidoreductase [Streptomyces sp. NBC_01373]